jgi:uncharacterized protein YdhG (YjbR/CyaY superfamily)
MKQTKDVDAYIGEAPEEIRDRLARLRRVIRKAAPKATERISYSMPFYEYGGTGYRGRLVYFAAFKKHLSVFFPCAGMLPRGLARKMEKYHAGKATYRFPLDQTVPFGLIGRVVQRLVKERDRLNRAGGAQ